MSSGRRSKAKPGKSNKNAPKPGKSAQPSISADEEPENLGFLYSIDKLGTKYDRDHAPRYLSVGPSKGNANAKLWFPPDCTTQFTRQNGDVYRWPGEMKSEIVQGYKRPEKKFQVASVFFQAKQDNFLAVMKDCTKVDISEEVNGWSHIGFHHLPGLLSQVDVAWEKQLLAAPADGCPWMPQVLPEVYNYDMKSPGVVSPGPSGGLCGKLSLLIAMAAFSAPVSDAETAVSRSFAYKSWELHDHETGRGRYQERGVIVTIYLDPEAVGVTSSHLKAFEGGKYGPILGPSAQATPLAPPTPGYTYQPSLGQAAFPTMGANTVPRILADTSVFPTSYPASSGYVAASGYPASRPMISQDDDLYEEEDATEPDKQADDGKR